ncbi:MAG: hypothetical protein ACRDZ3_04380 [Acidimicrobiia bacterium]
MPRPRPAQGKLEVVLRGIEQGDLISVGAVAIVGSHQSAVLAAAGDPGTGAGTTVASVTVECASGWYAVLTQDCDIVRRVEVEPCLAVAPVVYIPQEQWDRLACGQTSYREFPLDPAEVGPLDEVHARGVPDGHCPVVDLRFISSVDKTLLNGGFQRRVPLRGRHKARFQEWMGARFGRESFADPVAEVVLPTARAVLDGQLGIFRDQRVKAPASARTVASVSEWYVRCTDRYVEILGRRSAQNGKASGLLRAKGSDLNWNTTEVELGARQLTQMTGARIGKVGYSVKVLTADFATGLTVEEFETYALWTVQDEPPPEQ